MANEDMRQNWTDAALGWVENEALFDAVFAPLTEQLLATAALDRGQRVLDVGCGSGTLLKAAVAAGADAVGVDVSPGMVEAARRRVPSARVLVADAQSADLATEVPGRPFDRVVSRFGVMFFDDPVAAFANLRSATASGGGRIAFACWRTEEENPMMTLGQDLLVAALDEPREPEHPFAPGPTAFADPGHARTLLEEAGWLDVALAPYDFTIDYGFDGSDGVENRVATLMATSTGRRVRIELEQRLGPDGWQAVLDDVRRHLRDHLVDGAVRFPGAVWLVTARA